MRHTRTRDSRIARTVVHDVLARLGEAIGWTTDEVAGGCCRFELVPCDEVGGVASIRILATTVRPDSWFPVSRVDEDGEP